MARIKCEHCGRMVSRKKGVCSFCGSPLPITESGARKTGTGPLEESQSEHNPGSGSSSSFKKWLLYGLAALAVLCGAALYVWYSGSPEDGSGAGYESVFDHAVEKVEDGKYMAKFQHQGTVYNCNFVLENDIVVFAQVELAGRYMPLYAKLDHGEYFKAVLPDKSEEDFCFQFSMMNGHGFMTIDGINEEITVELLKKRV